VEEKSEEVNKGGDDRIQVERKRGDWLGRVRAGLNFPGRRKRSMGKAEGGRDY